jgi:hypothetical protein
MSQSPINGKQLSSRQATELMAFSFRPAAATTFSSI